RYINGYCVTGTRFQVLQSIAIVWLPGQRCVSERRGGNEETSAGGEGRRRENGATSESNSEWLGHPVEYPAPCSRGSLHQAECY
ncbi:hypothetical protein, partial [Acinetobacter baumannii]